MIFGGVYEIYYFLIKLIVRNICYHTDIVLNMVVGQIRLNNPGALYNIYIIAEISKTDPGHDKLQQIKANEIIKLVFNSGS